MLRISIVSLHILLFSTSFSQKIIEYPNAPKDSIVNIYFGTAIEDPYQWMENPDDPRLVTWLEEQERITKKVSHKQVKKSTLLAQLSSMHFDVESETVDSYIESKREAKSKYVFKNRSNNYNRYPDLLYKDRNKDSYKVLVKIKDFQTSSKDNVHIKSKYVNDDEDLIAIELTHNGSDWNEVYFFDLKSGKQLSDTLKHIRYANIIWEGRNVYYSRFDEAINGRELLDKATGQKLCYHTIGQVQSEDKLLYKDPDAIKTESFRMYEKDDVKFLFHSYLNKGNVYKAISRFTYENTDFSLKNFLIYPNDESIDLNVEFFIGDTAYIRSNWNAPNGMVLKATTNQLNTLEELVPEYDVILWDVDLLGKDKIACTYRNKGVYSVLIFNNLGKMLKIFDFPEGKKVNDFYEYDEDVEYTEFSLSSFYHPDLSYQLSLNDLKYNPSEALSVPYDPESLETRYIYYPSKDGMMIPMYITCLKGTILNGENPVLIYGYGGYGHNVEPHYSEEKVLWVLHGGILAIPNIRGSGAEGGEWGMAGRRLEKQNAIDDFIAAAEYLIDEQYTNSDKIAINGGSHGGMLVTAALTQRPELFDLVIAQAGAIDMLRFENFTVGSASLNLLEFGTVTDSLDFENLLSYSPLHTIKKGVKYPNVLLITGDKDDRVPPFHSYKFLATLQENGDPSSDYILYVIPEAGHQGAINSNDWLDVLLFKNYYLYDKLGLSFY